MTSAFPVHPQPLTDELFSSWVYRVARANGQNVFSFCYLLIPEMRNTYYNLDYVVTEQILQKLSMPLRVTYFRSRETTLDSYSGKLFARSTPKANRKTCILQTGSQKNNHRRYCLQYCPLCLAEGEPYYRKVWRVSFITVCSRHACQLYDRCPRCSSPIRPLLNDVGQPHKMPFLGAITQCFHCAFDLKNTAVCIAKADVVEDTILYERILREGFIKLEVGSNWIYSFSFFQVLRHLMRLVLREVVRDQEKDNIQDPDMLPHNLRYQCMSLLSGVFSNWPSQFIAFCINNKLLYSDFTNNTNKRPLIPYWLEKNIRQNLYSPNSPPSEQSVIAAIDYLIAHDKRLNASALNRLLGYEDSGVIKNVLKSYQRNKLFHLPYMRKPE